MSGGVKKFCQMTNLTMLNDVSSTKCALELVPGLVDAGVPHGDENGPRTLDQKCTHTTLISEENGRVGMVNSQHKGQIRCERM